MLPLCGGIKRKEITSATCVRDFLFTFLEIIAENVYMNGFNAELIGRIRTAVQAYISPGITCPDKARKPADK
jgi:hypothetical protein